MRELVRSDAPRLARWLRKVCSDPRSHCIHTFAGEDESELAADLERQLDDSLSYFVIESNGDWLATMGCDVSVELRRGWLHGPHVPWTRAPVLVAETPEAHREALRVALGCVVRSRFEGRVSDVSAYVALTATELIDYYRSRGFVQRRVEHVFRLDREGFSSEAWIGRCTRPWSRSSLSDWRGQSRSSRPPEPPFVLRRVSSFLTTRTASFFSTRLRPRA